MKTPRARREIPLPTYAVDVLRRHRKEQAERQLALGEGWFRDEALGELVIDRGDGGPIDPDNFTAAVKRFGKAAGLDRRTRLHDIRHAVATQLARDRVELVTVSAILGHSSAAFTATTYQHAFEGMKRAAADSLGAAFFGDAEVR